MKKNRKKPDSDFSIIEPLKDVAGIFALGLIFYAFIFMVSL